MLPLKKSDSPFPRPDWEAVYESQVGVKMSDAELTVFWTDLGRDWMQLLRPALGSAYKIYESANFWLVSDQPEKTCRHLVQWAEATHAKVLKLVDVDATKHLFGKCPILIVPDLETYDAYCALYIPEEHLGPSGGVFLNHGYGHFIFPFYNLNQAEPVLVHELAHSLVSHLPLPAWVNEGVAQLCENIISGADSIDYEKIKEFSGTFWTSETIQDFWSGKGFSRFDEGQILSYHLAREVTRELAADRMRFLPFLRDAEWSDSGAAALSAHFGLTLSELIADYLGAGDWAPQGAMQK
ncbi:MAG: hypothetical protein H7Y06_11580 [Opitutaceae bacterium]|nr:hypothetical protein [Opitutaceae bacterium]